MKELNLLTVLFVSLKLGNIIDWNWLLVFLPSILCLGIRGLGMTVASVWKYFR